MSVFFIQSVVVTFISFVHVLHTVRQLISYIRSLKDYMSPLSTAHRTRGSALSQTRALFQEAVVENSVLHTDTNDHRHMSDIYKE